MSRHLDEALRRNCADAAERQPGSAWHALLLEEMRRRELDPIAPSPSPAIPEEQQ